MSQHVDPAALNSSISILSSRLVVVETSFGSLNADKQFDYPDGFNQSNTIILALMAYIGNDQWDIVPRHNITEVDARLTTTKVQIWTNNSAIAGKSVRVALFRYS